MPGTAASTSLLKLGTNSQTISGGAITATNSYIQLVGDTGNYELSTINVSNGPENGTVIVLQANNPSSSITVNHNTNILLNNSQNCTLTGYNTLQLIYNSIPSSWLELSRTSIQLNPQLSVSNIIKFVNDDPFSLTELVSKQGDGALSFSSNNVNVATILSDSVTIVGAGTTTITVTLAASSDGVYSQATTTATLTVNKRVPSLFLSGITKSYGDIPFSLTGLVSKQGNGVLSFTSSESGVATIDVDNVTIVGAGTTIITVTLAASSDGVYSQATTTATLTVSVSSTPIAVISFLQGSNVTLTEYTAYFLADYVASSNSSQPLIYSYVNYPNQPYIEFDNISMGDGVYIMSPNQSGGSVSVTVSQNGDNNYLAPNPVTLYVTVSI